MSRDHSPVELLHMAGQPGVRDPENGDPRAKPARINAGGPLDLDRGNEDVYRQRQADYATGRMSDPSSSSTDFEHARPTIRESGA